MQFSSIIAASILAYTASAVPFTSNTVGSSSSSTAVRSSSTSSASATASATATMTASAPSGTSTGLSLTAQLFLADTAVDRFNLLPNDKDFVFDFANPPPPQKLGSVGKGGDLIAANRKTFPALVSTGAGMAVGFLGPCGFNTPHVHPRSVELQIVTNGTLVTEMVPENGVMDPTNTAKRRVIRNTVEQNQMQPFYQGSVHTQFNPNCYNATFVAAFTSEDFGAGQIADEFFSLSDDVVIDALGQAVDAADLEKFRKAIPKSIAIGVETCMSQCGIPKR